MCTRLTPTSHVTPVDNGYQATIQLPVNCKLKHTIKVCISIEKMSIKYSFIVVQTVLEVLQVVMTIQFFLLVEAVVSVN